MSYLIGLVGVFVDAQEPKKEKFEDQVTEAVETIVSCQAYNRAALEAYRAHIGELCKDAFKDSLDVTQKPNSSKIRKELSKRIG